MSGHMTVWRIEHKTEVGPDGLPLGPYARNYEGDDGDVAYVADIMIQQHGIDDPQRPCWFDETFAYDGKLKAAFGIPNYTALRAGFDSGRQLVEWFTTDQRELLELAGYVVRKYLVPVKDVALGRRQVAFFAHEARDAGTLALTSV